MKTLTLTLALLAAAPALAQSAPPAPPPQQGAGAPGMEGPRGERRVFIMRRDGGPMMGGMGPMGGLMTGVSPEGRAVLRDALRGQEGGDRDALRAARDRVASLLSAERLDVAALRRAMDEERRQVDAQQNRRQAAMLEAYQKLSLSDRLALVANARAGRDRIEERVAEAMRMAGMARGMGGEGPMRLREYRMAPPPAAPTPPAPPAQ